MTLSVVAKLVGVSVQTLRRWFSDGVLSDDYRRVVHGVYSWREFSEDDVTELRRFVLLNKGRHDGKCSGVK